MGPSTINRFCDGGAVVELWQNQPLSVVECTVILWQKWPCPIASLHCWQAYLSGFVRLTCKAEMWNWSCMLNSLLCCNKLSVVIVVEQFTAWSDAIG